MEGIKVMLKIEYYIDESKRVSGYQHHCTSIDTTDYDGYTSLDAIETRKNTFKEAKDELLTHVRKLRDELTEFLEKEEEMTVDKEIHVWLENNYTFDILTDFKSTNNAISNDIDIVHTTQTHFLSWEYNRRLFVHVTKDDLKGHEITLGKCEGTNREIRRGHNIEKMLLSGEFDWFEI